MSSSHLQFIEFLSENGVPMDQARLATAKCMDTVAGSALVGSQLAVLFFGATFTPIAGFIAGGQIGGAIGAGVGFVNAQ